MLQISNSDCYSKWEEVTTFRNNKTVTYNYQTMASAFWILEDGRGFARSWAAMSSILELITNELRDIDNAKDFYEYLEPFVFRKENGDEYNGYGGFIRKNENIMLNFDLRTFSPKSRYFFWEAAQNVLIKIKAQNDNNNERIEVLLTTLLDMHKRIKKAEDPMSLNDMRIILPKPTEKKGPGW